ncbi:hypothetical protein ABFA07_023455 [Porites harrisoni]
MSVFRRFSKPWRRTILVSRIVFTAHARALARQKEQVPKCHVGGTVNVGLSQSRVETRTVFKLWMSQWCTNCVSEVYNVD